MNNQGFISIVVVCWFVLILEFISSGLIIINNYQQSKKNIDKAAYESEIEAYAINQAKYLWDEYEEENFCDYVNEVEFCIIFKDLNAEITIDYPDDQRILSVVYNTDCYCLIEISHKVDK